MRYTMVVAALLLAACGTPTDPAKEGPGSLLTEAKHSPPAAPGSVAPTATPAPAIVIPGSKVLVVNGNFEAPALGRGEFEGWSISQHAGVHSYDFDLDTQVKHGRKQSLRITSVGPEVYGVAFQTLPAGGLAGRTVELSAWIRTAQATGTGAQLTLIARGSHGIGAHKFMNDPAVTGTQDWQRYSVRMNVPKDSTTLEIGLMLQGPGTMWIDDVTLSTIT